MKNYDDLQRFKEKTQTLDIAFKDMSGQLQEPAENSQWTLIRQLANNEETSTPFSGSQRIDLPQPQPLRGDEFHARAAAPALRQPLAVAPAAARSTLLDSLTGSAPAAAAPARASLFPPPPEPMLAPAEPAPASALPAPAVSAPSSASAPRAAPERRFSGLFRARHSEPASLPKETLLKPLLEKIALCR
jgi:hypothetical protein